MSKFLREIVNPHEDIAPKGLEDRLKAHYWGLHGDSFRSPIRKYTSGKSEGVNHYLWERHKNPLHHAMDDNIEGKVESLDSVVHHAKTPEDMTVYSKVEYDPRGKKNAENIVHHPAFMSTSINKNYAKGFRVTKNDHHILAIHLPKGSPGAFVSHISEFPEEQEHILPRGMNLKIHKTETETHKRISRFGTVISDQNINYHIHHATIESHHDPEE